MATLPEEEDPPQTVVERVKHAVVVPVERNHSTVLLALAAGAGSTAPFPFGIVVAGACVLAAAGMSKRK